ncbi:MAG TPA: ATP synthase F0F1 subunit beta, partial [Deltaproteobacteria bacterium]|nr:ATP synthase F0F1 subunit beta [Deltaproteobacteria bacterium]
MSEQVNRGTVVSVRGSVVDAWFPQRLPDIFNVLRTGDDNRIVIEVNTHLNANTVRGIALTPTQGLGRGAEVVDTGRFLEVPVGKGLLGRV